MSEETKYISIPEARWRELLQELRVVREQCSEQSQRIARIVGELTSDAKTDAQQVMHPQQRNITQAWHANSPKGSSPVDVGGGHETT